MTPRTFIPESVLTPAFARSLIRLAMLRTGPVIIDEDLVQETLLRGWIAFRRSGHVEYPRAFLAKIARDTVRDHWRGQNVLVSLDYVGKHRLSYLPDLEHKLDRDRRLGEIRKALNLLPAQRRDLMERFYIEGFSIHELSALMNKSRSALKMAILRSRRVIVRMVRHECEKQNRRTKCQHERHTSVSFFVQ